MPALTAKGRDPTVRPLRERLACERRLLMVCHAVPRDRRPFDPKRAEA